MLSTFVTSRDNNRRVISRQQFIEMEARLARTHPPPPSNAAKRELELHDQIIKYCNEQWPRWKYIHANPTDRSTIAPGAQDFTIFLPGKVVLCIECKAKTGKQSDDQLIWACEMKRLGFTVEVVRAFEEFVALTTAYRASNQSPREPDCR